MLGGLLTAAIAYGAQWIQSPTGRKAIQTCGQMALIELGKRIEKHL